MREKLKKALGLYWYFFKIGWFTFGGGWSINAYVDRALSGVRAVVPPVILSAVLKLQNTQTTLPRRAAYALCRTNYLLDGTVQLGGIVIGIIGGYLLLYRKWSVPKVICAGAILGMIL